MGFYGDLIKTFSHRVNNRSNKKIRRRGHGRKEMFGIRLESAGVDEVDRPEEAVLEAGDMSGPNGR